MRFGRSLNYNLSGDHNRAVKGGHLDFSFAVLQIQISPDAMTDPFVLNNGKVRASGFHLGKHTPSPDALVGLQGSDKEPKWSVVVRSVIMCAQTEAVWTCRASGLSVHETPTWTVYAVLDKSSQDQLLKDKWWEQNLVRAQALGSCCAGIFGGRSAVSSPAC